MKLAVLLYGHLRDFERCAESLNNYLLKLYDCDVFIHTWDETDHNTVSHHNRKIRIHKVDNEIKRIIEILYQPKSLEIEHQEKHGQEVIINFKGVEGLKFSSKIPYFTFYTMKKANNQRKHEEIRRGISYDYVIVTRPDIELKTEFIVDNYINQARILGFNLDRSRFFAAKPLHSKVVNSFYINEPNDLLFFGKPCVIDRYIDANQNISEKYMKEHCINVVSIYTAKEIEAGIVPIPMSYSLGLDWTFFGYRKINYFDYQSFRGLKKVIAKCMVNLANPVLRLKKKYPWIGNE